jgi:hypothetical protein
MYQLMDDKTETTGRQPPNQWAEIIGQLFDKLVGKNMAMTYSFDNLTIDLPKAEGPNGQLIGSAKWTINGKVIITTETFKKDDVASESMER